MRRTVEERFFSKVNKLPSGCWEWQARKSKAGYGILKVSRPRRNALAHRLIYEMSVGPIPDGLEIDHLCRNPACVNPEHLEAVTHRDNMLRGFGWSGRNARKTHCPKGHEYNAANTYIRRLPDGRGQRHCRVCWRGKTDTPPPQKRVKMVLDP